MEKLYTDEEYANKAIEANSKGQMLYVYTYDTEYQIDVLEFQDVERQTEKLIVDENGEPILDENGELQYEIITEVVQEPVMETVEEPNPKAGEIHIEVDPETGEEVEVVEPDTIQVERQKSHKETKIKEVGELLIAPTDFYICYKENYTHKEVNPDYEKDIIAERENNFKNQFIETIWGWYRKQPKGYANAPQSVDVIFNMVNTLGNFTTEIANLMIFYKQPDFTIEEQCSEEWLIANQFKHKATTKEEFMKFYIDFQTKWATEQYK